MDEGNRDLIFLILGSQLPKNLPPNNLEVSRKSLRHSIYEKLRMKFTSSLLSVGRVELTTGQ